MYTTWNIWKERNRRIFNGRFATLITVFQLFKEEMKLRSDAMGVVACLPYFNYVRFVWR
jgi:hypothetical protein